MDDMHREQTSRLMAEISALLEDTHELAITGQSSVLSENEIKDLAAAIANKVRQVEGLADKILAFPNLFQ